MINQSATKKYSVLIVDDQPNWRELLGDLLDERFYVENAKSYDEALRIIQGRNSPFHVVVTDMRLADNESDNEDGLKLIEYLNKQGTITQKIVLTGYPTIRTALYAVSKLKASHYLEKYRSEKDKFDSADFVRSVQKAAEEAERQRPKGFTGINKNILLVESDIDWQNDFLAVLRGSHIAVDAFSTSSQLHNQLSGTRKLYDLVLISKSLIYSDVTILDLLNDTQSKAGVVVLDHNQNLPLPNLVQDHVLADIFTFEESRGNLKDGLKFDRIRFLERLKALLMREKYLLLEITHPDNKTASLSSVLPLRQGVTYKAIITLQDEPSEYSWQIFPNHEEMLRFFLYVEQMKVEPGVEWTWKINGIGNSCPPFFVTPAESGQKKIMLEISQGFRLLCRTSFKVEVR